MNYDELIKSSILQAVEEADQDPKLAALLIKWFQEVSSGNESLHDTDPSRRHAEILYEATARDQNGNGG